MKPARGELKIPCAMFTMLKESHAFNADIAPTINMCMDQLSGEHTFTHSDGTDHVVVVKSFCTGDLKALESMAGLGSDTCFYCGCAYITQGQTPERWGKHTPQNSPLFPMKYMFGLSPWLSVIPDYSLHARLRVASSVINMLVSFVNVHDASILYPSYTNWMSTKDFSLFPANSPLKLIHAKNVKAVSNFNARQAILNADPEKNLTLNLKNAIRETRAVQDNHFAADIAGNSYAILLYSLFS